MEICLLQFEVGRLNRPYSTDGARRCEEGTGFVDLHVESTGGGDTVFGKCESEGRTDQKGLDRTTFRWTSRREEYPFKSDPWDEDSAKIDRGESRRNRDDE